MKKYILYVFLFIMGGLAGCDSLFDDEVPPHNLSGENLIMNESSAETVLNGVYSYLKYVGNMSAYYIADNEYRLNFLSGTYRGDFEEEGLLKFMLNEEYNYVEEPWKVAYKLVNAANNFIFYTEKVSEDKFGLNRKTEMLAEARFMRGWANLFLLRRYGYFWDINSKFGIILRLEPSALSNNSRGRETVSICYQKIIDDFDYAIQYAPEHYSKFRACKTLAKAYKADLLMSRGVDGDYENAARLADEVLKSGNFELEANYADIFKNGYTSKELMFTRYLDNPPEMDDNMGSLLKMFGGGVYSPTEQYIEVFPESDLRYSVTFDSVPKSDTDTIKKMIWKKHYVANGDCPMYYMRLAQMHLIKAEAMAYTGSSKEEVLAELNNIRRGNPAFKASDYATMDDVVNEIFNEALRDIGMENGALFFMAVRMKKDGVRKIAYLNPNFEKDDQLCFPIPKAELEHNFDVEQKPM